jgi:hypothetical protein
MKEFTPAADEVGRLQRTREPEGLYFREIAEQGHYGGRTKPTNTRQGLYMFAPSGEFLAAGNTTRPGHMLALMQKGLKAWKALAKDKRYMKKKPDDFFKGGKRWETKYPEEGLVLEVHSRDLLRKKGKSPSADRRNIDYAWFNKDEIKDLIPDKLRKGQKKTLDEKLVKRIIGCHMLDNVLGQTRSVNANNIEIARMLVTVVSKKRDLVELKYEGEVAYKHSGVWSICGYKDMKNPSQQERGYEGKLMGSASYNSKTKKFESIEWVSAGTRWGGTQYNFRCNDLPRAPIGFVFKMQAPDKKINVAPAHIWNYGWRSP